jgi:opacity protein-like surface antigen
MKKILVAMLVLTGLVTVSKAADTKYEVGVMPGISIPFDGASWGNTTTGVKSSFAADVYGDYKINDMFMAGLDLGYDFSHKLQDGALGQGATNNDNMRITSFHVAPEGKYYHNLNMFGKNGKVYGVLGAGLYTLKLKSDNQLYDNGTDPDGKGYFGFNVGVGADVEVVQNWLVGLDVRWHHICTNYQGLTATNDLTPSLKVAYTF